ncbi:ATP-grasp domain-containing protein [Holophaga foetida]|uniref:ATP-grasp domain-containing protein n=1 Tax=Holophaga foetida TaxID=35839 RepID=UPI0002473F46|nr:ATP-grasp domain-containing protein [Holophaga foetida]
MNILITSAGRRNYLVRWFKEAFTNSEREGKVICGDASPMAPALQEADEAIHLPLVSSPDYVDHLLAVCKAKSIRLVVPLNDLELPILAAARARFLEEDIILAVSDPQVIDLCFDKLATHRFLQRVGLFPPLTFASISEARGAIQKGSIQFPIIMKPRWGSASIGVEVVRSETEMAEVHPFFIERLKRTILAEVSSQNEAQSVLIQEFLPCQEFSLDVVNDLQGNHVTTFAKKKIAMRAGETDKAITVDIDALSSAGRVLGEKLGHVGNLDCDVFWDGEFVRVLELNPRFGGAYPFSHAAGANLPAALLAWALGEEAEPEWLRIKPGVASAKFDQITAVQEA